MPDETCPKCGVIEVDSLVAAVKYFGPGMTPVTGAMFGKRPATHLRHRSRRRSTHKASRSAPSACGQPNAPHAPHKRRCGIQLEPSTNTAILPRMLDDLTNPALVAGTITALATLLAAIIAVRFSKPTTVVVEHQGHRKTVSRADVDRAITSLSDEWHIFHDTAFTTADVLCNAFDVILDAGTIGPSYRARYLAQVMVRLPSASDARTLSEQLEAAAKRSTPGEDNAFVDEAAAVFGQITASLIAFNVMTNYRADSQFHSVNTFLLTDFGQAVMKILKLYPKRPRRLTPPVHSPGASK